MTKATETLPPEAAAVAPALEAPPAARAAREVQAPGEPRRRALLWWRPPPSLYLRVFLVNAALLIVATVVLAVSPATVSFPVRPEQALMLALGLAVVLTANAVLLRVSLRPLRDLARLMREIDLLLPGARVPEEGVAEMRAVIETFNTMLSRLELERRASTSRSAQNQEEERRRVSNELHDEVGQGLTAVLLQLRSLAEDAPEDLEPRLAAAQKVVRTTLDEVRRIARQLRPTVLDDLGLPYAIEALLDTYDSAPFELTGRIEHDLPPLLPPVELALFRIAQEGLTNAARHAGASLVELEVGVVRRHVQMTIRDDGAGISLETVRDGGGIRGMRERALAIGASLRISAAPAGGTVVTVRVPIGR